MTSLPLDGQVALITGANRGIGRAIALEFVRQGAQVVATARDPQAAEGLGAALVLPCDVANYIQVGTAVEAAHARLGRLDILVNNAGVVEPIGLLEASDPVAWAHNITVNLVGAMHGCRAALPLMLTAGGGVIINISSGAASRAIEGWSAYCAGKAGLAMLTMSLHLECHARGIRAYGLRPGVVDTDMQAMIRASGINEISRLKREQLGDPALPARLAAYLCTPAAADLAGQEVEIRDEAVRQRVGL